MIEQLLCQNCKTSFRHDIPDVVDHTELACPMCGETVFFNRVATADANDMGRQPPKVEFSSIAEITGTTSQNESRKSSRKTTVVAVVVIAVVAIIIAVTASLNRPKRGEPNVIYDVDLGVGIRLGQTKESIDKALGEGDEYFGKYEYPNSLSVSYTDGKATRLELFMESRWETGAGFTEATTVDDVKAAYGEPYSEESGAISYIFDKTSSGRPYYVVYGFTSNGYGKENTLGMVLISNEFD